MLADKLINEVELGYVPMPDCEFDGLSEEEAGRLREFERNFKLKVFADARDVCRTNDARLVAEKYREVKSYAIAVANRSTSVAGCSAKGSELSLQITVSLCNIYLNTVALFFNSLTGRGGGGEDMADLHDAIYNFGP